jgi:LPXTG-motif cell wall-anchored protein
MKKLVLLFGTGLLALLSMLAVPASAQGATGTVTVIHGIPGLAVDVYVNDKLTLEDFAPDTVTAPLELPAGTYQIAIRPANAAADSAPVLAGSATLPAGANASIVAHLDASGKPALTVFVNDTSALAAGNARLVVRHTAAAPAVDVLANGKPAFTSLTNPNQATADLPAGTISAAVAAAGTTTPVIGPVDLTLPGSTVTIVYAVGSLDGKTLHTLSQSIPVSTTPASTTAPIPPTGGELPKTGSSTGLLVAIGLGSLVVGVIVTRRFATR